MRICCILLLVLASLALSAQQSKPLTIKGDLSKVKEQIEQVVLYYTNNNHTSDSCLVKNGQYHFEIKIAKPSGARLMFRTTTGVNPEYSKWDQFSHFVYLEPGIMTIASTDSVSNCITTGSKWDADYQEYLRKINEYIAILKPLQEQIKKYYDAKDSVSAQKFEKHYAKYTDSLLAKVSFDFALAHPYSPVAFDALNSAAGYPFNGERMKPVFEKLPLSVQNTPEGKELKDKIENVLKLGIGKMAPDFTQPDTAGKPVTLSSFRGKYVLLDFWANWCGFCRLESPYMIKAFEKYKDKGFTILSVSIDKKEDKEKWLKAIQKDGTHLWPQVSDLRGKENAAFILYAITGIPANYLIDTEGKIIALNLRGNDLETKLEQILGK